MRRRSFTPAEANAIVPALEDAFRRIDDHKREAREQHDRLQVLELLWGDELKKPGGCAPSHESSTAG